MSSYTSLHSRPDIVPRSAGKVKRGDEGDAFGMGFRFPWQKKEKDKEGESKG